MLSSKHVAFKDPFQRLAYVGTRAIGKLRLQHSNSMNVSCFQNIVL